MMMNIMVNDGCSCIVIVIGIVDIAVIIAIRDVLTDNVVIVFVVVVGVHVAVVVGVLSKTVVIVD